ncbi:armadillo-type protein [Glomus cerebriforme]|uniref:Armadillo-type protein n=1 Tax=Glomus cerebriforme TaxID=658196 RepID=A0A397S613_9GLOM|nr:armadillo-type protein [Glomus cerebriforme]
MDKAAYETLSLVLSSDPNIRQAAESRLKELEKLPGWFKLKIFIASERVSSQKTAINLKNYIETHWSPSNNKFIDPEPNFEIKAVVRELAFNGLSDPSNKIRVASAYVVSKIANNDWPEYWPNLLDLLVSQLKTGSPDQVHGSMRVLNEFFTNDITEQQFSQVTPLLLPELSRILQSEGIHSYKTRGRAITIFKQCIEILVMLKEEHPETIEPFLKPILPEWLQVFSNILKKRTIDNEEIENEEYGLKLEVVKFVGLSVRKKAAKPLFENNDGKGGFLKQIIWIIISYMQMTEEQAEIWSSDANQFVADDDDETFNYSVRVAAIDLLQVLLDKFSEQSLQALADTTKHLIEESDKARAAGDTGWWKMQEACLKAIGYVSDDFLSMIQESKVNFDLSGLFEHVVFKHITATENPFLQGRAIVFSSQFATFLSEEFASRYVAATVEAIQRIESIPVKVSALRALQNFCRHLDTQYVAPYQSNIIEAVATLLNVTSEDSLILVLETLEFAIKINNEVTAGYEHVIGPLVIDVWMKNPTDHLIASVITDLFESLASNTTAYAAFQARALPSLVNIINNVTDSAAISSAIDLIASLVKGGPSPLPPSYVEHIFPSLIHLMLMHEDRSILQSGEVCLKYFIQKDCEHIAQWTDTSGKTGLDYVIQYIAKALQPKESESAGFLGDLVVKLIKKAGNRIVPVLPDLLKAAATKLEGAKTATFIQSLVMIFAHLMLNQLSTVVEFLSTLDINGRSGLEILLNTWLENHESFQGYYSIKVSAIALSKLFLSGDPRIQGIQVKGDLVVTNSSRIMTRSRTRKDPDQYTYVSANVKIIKLLISDLQNSSDSDIKRDYEEYDDEDSVETDDGCDEWEDVEEPSPFAPAEDYVVLSEYLDRGKDLDDVDDDPEIKEDPVYLMNLRDYLTDFFRHCAMQNENNFVQLCSELNEEYQQKIQSLINGEQT